MDGDGVLLATAVATAIATTVSLIVSVWWRWADRREPDWMVLKPSTIFGNKSPDAAFEYSRVDCWLTNVGDAPGHHVRVRGFGCKATFGIPTSKMIADGEQSELMPVVASGQAECLRVWSMPEDWGHAFVVISWVVSPTRRRRSRRAQRVWLRDVCEPPVYSYRYSGGMTSGGAVTFDTDKEVPENFTVPEHLAPDVPVPPDGPSWWWAWRAERRARRRATKRDW
jgi:hypothetical protein